MSATLALRASASSGCICGQDRSDHRAVAGHGPWTLLGLDPCVRADALAL